jgi:hypothetical protein
MAIGPQISVHEAGKVWDLAFRTVGVVRQSEDYGYEDDRLVRVVARVDSSRTPSRSAEQRLTHDAGRLAEVTVIHPDGTTQRVYQRAKKGESLSALAKRVGARLLRSIPESLAATKLSGQVYCLVLIYHDRYAPPDLVVGMERDRDRLLARHGAEARYHLFVPSEPWVQVWDPDFEAEYSLFEQRVSTTEGWDLARSMLRRAAEGLARRDWAGIMEVTPDFVVYAADYEADDIAEAIAASNEPSRVAELRARGWL